MIKREAVGDASAPVVSHDGEPVEPKPLHDRHHVTRHGSLGVGLVVGSRARFAADPVAAQVGGNHGEFASKARSDLVCT